MSDGFDILAPHFRRATDRWPDARTLANHYRAVVDSYQSNQHGLIETVKSFVECFCLSVLGEYGKPMPSSDPSMTEMLVETLKVLGLHNTRGASKLDRVLSAHNRLADALSDMRNENGPVAHGKDGFLDTLTSNHVRAYVLTADTLLALLLAALEGSEPDIRFTREPYERFSHLHDRIDGSVMVESLVEYEDDSPVVVISLTTGILPEGLELRIEPSRLVYSIDRQAYIELLAASAAEAAPGLAGKGTKAEELLPVPSASMKEPTAPVEVVPTYTGFLSVLKEQLQEYVASLDLPEPSGGPAGANLIDSLLGTAEANMGIDWRDREALQARMKVSFRRILVQFGISEDAARNCAEHLVAWFRIQSVGLLNGGGGPTHGK